MSSRLYVDSLNIYHEHTFHTPFTRSNTSLNLRSISEFPQYPLIIFSNTRDTKVCRYKTCRAGRKRPQSSPLYYQKKVGKK